MDIAFVVNAQTGASMSPQPVQFLRIPVPGELVFAAPNMYSVVRVVHSWSNGPNPVAAVHLTPAQPHAASASTLAGHVNPF